MNMRWIYFCAMVCSLAYGALDKDSLQKTLKANNINGKILSNTELSSGISMVVLEVGNQNIPLLATDDGKMIFQDVSMLQDKALEARIDKMYRKLYEKEKVKINARLKEVFKSQSTKVFRFASKKNTNKSIYIVSDPNCPYCQKDFENLDKHLEKANVELLLVGFLSEDSMLKAANAIKNKSGNQAKDIMMLRTLYSPKSKGKAMDTHLAEDVTRAVSGAGVRSVPYIIE